jgi:DNA-binding NarL/FixJ family response regulator
MSLPHPSNPSESLWQPASVRVLIADDNDLYAEALALTLDLEPGIELVGRARNGAEAVELAVTLETDVVLMDLDMPVLDGLGATRAVLEALPSSRVVMVTASADDEDERRAHEAGVAAYVRKGGFAGELFDAIFGARERSRPQAAPPESPPVRPPRSRGTAATHALRAFQ